MKMTKSFCSLTVLSFVLVGCSLPKSYDIKPLEKESIDDILSKDLEVLEELVEFFEPPKEESSKKGDSSSETPKPTVENSTEEVINEKLKDYIFTSISTSDTLCKYFFDLQMAYSDKLDKNQSHFNIIGDYGVAMASLTGASNKVLTMGASALGLGNSLFDVDKGLRLTETLGNLYDQVKQTRVELANTIKTNDYSLFKEAQRDIRDYHATCSRLELIEYISDSVEYAKFNPGSSEKQIELDLAARELNTMISGNNSPLSNESLLSLYAFGALGDDGIEKELKDEFIKNNKFLSKKFDDFKEKSEFTKYLFIAADVLGLDKMLNSRVAEFKDRSDPNVAKAKFEAAQAEAESAEKKAKKEAQSETAKIEAEKAKANFTTIMYKYYTPGAVSKFMQNGTIPTELNVDANLSEIVKRSVKFTPDSNSISISVSK